jgi:hypothetical protein
VAEGSAPPPDFSVRAAARISWTDIFLAIAQRPVQVAKVSATPLPAIR